MIRKLMCLWPRRPRSVVALALVACLATATSLYLWLPVQPRWSFTTGIHPRLIGFTPDGRRLLVSHADQLGLIQLLDANSGQLSAELQFEDGVGANEPILSPDGKLLATWNSRTVVVLGIPSGRVATTLRLNPKERCWLGCQFSPDSKTLLCSRLDAQDKFDLVAWDLTAPRERFVLPNQSRYAAYSPDGRILATGMPTRALVNQIPPGAGELRLWDADTGQLLDVLSGCNGNVGSFVCGPSRGILAAGCFNRICEGSESAILLWDTTTRGLTGTIQGYRTAEFTPDGMLLRTSKTDIGARMAIIGYWDARSGKLSHMKTFPFPANNLATCAEPVMSPDCRTVALGCGYWIAASGVRAQLANFLGSSRLARAASWYELKLFDAVTGEERARIPGDDLPNQIGSLEPLFTPDGTRLATIGYNQIRLWDIPPRRPIAWIIAISLLPAILVFAMGFGLRVSRVLVHLANTMRVARPTTPGG